MRIQHLAFFALLFAQRASAQDSVTYKPLPLQFSIVPGISSHGRADRQIVNHFSLNLVGGREAGLQGMALAGAFNIDAHDAGYIQVAGLFNTVGGAATGVQLAGVLNRTRDSVRGVQVAGLVNLAGDSVRGAQLAGLANVSRHNVYGAQLAGLYNQAVLVRGVQMSGLVNRATRVHGAQIGLVNIADTSDGYTVGLVNIVRKNGFRQVSVSTADVTGVAVAFKSGTRRLYGIIQAGAQDWSGLHNYSAGVGLGTQIDLGSQWTFNGEVVHQQVFTDSWKFLGEIVRGQPTIGFRISPHAILAAGPTLNLYAAPAKLPSGSHVSDIPGTGWPSNGWGKHTEVWLGGAVGLSFF